MKLLQFPQQKILSQVPKPKPETPKLCGAPLGVQELCNALCSWLYNYTCSIWDQIGAVFRIEVPLGTPSRFALYCRTYSSGEAGVSTEGYTKADPDLDLRLKYPNEAIHARNPEFSSS